MEIVQLLLKKLETLKLLNRKVVCVHVNFSLSKKELDFSAKVKYAVEKKVSLHLMPNNLDFQCK